MLRVALPVAVCALACSGPAAVPRPAQAPASTPATPALSFGELDDLLNTPDAPRLESAPTIAAYRATIRDRLTRPEFYDAFVPTMLTVLDVPQALRPILWNDILAKGVGRDGKPYFFLERIGDCHGTEIDQVHPWWALTTQVAVCHSSVRADVMATSDGTYCDASAAPLPECGCGPNLIQCALSPKWRKESAKQTRAELRRTMRHIVMNKLPYSTILTTQDTVRSTFGDFYYAREAFFRGAPLQMPRVANDDGTLVAETLNDFEMRPRGPEHRGGLLTTPVFLFADGSRRVSVQNLWNDFLCVDWSTTTVDPHTLLKLSTDSNDIRVGANSKLIETPGCKECHVRLEYPTLAIDEYTNFFKGTRYIPRAAPAMTKLYVHGSTDLRATFPATAGDLGANMAAQPEFQTCAVKKVLDYVYQGYPVPERVRSGLLARFANGQDLGALLEDALIARIFGGDAIEGGTR